MPNDLSSLLLFRRRRRGAPSGPAIRLLLETGDKLLLEAGGPVELGVGIPAQPEADPLDGTEWTVIVQDGATKRVSTLTLRSFVNG